MDGRVNLNGFDEQDIVGRGWAFPVRPGVRGTIALTHTNTETIERAIRLILQTVKGERVMRPEFGSDLHLLTFAPNDPTTVGQAEYYVREALARWERRIEIEGIDVTWGEMHRGVMLIEINYRVKATNDKGNLVYPFYSIPEEE